MKGRWVSLNYSGILIYHHRFNDISFFTCNQRKERSFHIKPYLRYSICAIFINVFSSLRKRPFLLALRRWGRFARRNVCDSATKISYWWRKICPESGQKSWLVDGVVPPPETSLAAKSQEKRMFSQAMYLAMYFFFLLETDRHSTWSSKPREGQAACSAKEVPSFLSHFKTLSNGPVQESNPRPPALQSSALPTKLILPRYF